MITLPAGVWQETLNTFRSCGAGTNECVIYWCAPTTTPVVIDVAVHPEHLASPMMYEIERTWLNRFGFDLARQGKSVVVQVHTHAGEAFHSSTDDRWPMVTTPGFLSLVLPHFALHRLDHRSMHLAELKADGRFAEVPVDSRMRFVA
jgi:hypothetical protein